VVWPFSLLHAGKAPKDFRQKEISSPQPQDRSDPQLQKGHSKGSDDCREAYYTSPCLYLKAVSLARLCRPEYRDNLLPDRHRHQGTAGRSTVLSDPAIKVPADVFLHALKKLADELICHDPILTTVRIKGILRGRTNRTRRLEFFPERSRKTRMPDLVAHWFKSFRKHPQEAEQPCAPVDSCGIRMADWS